MFYLTQEPGRAVFVSNIIFFFFNLLLLLSDNSRSSGILALLYSFSQYISL